MTEQLEFAIDELDQLKRHLLRSGVDGIEMEGIRVSDLREKISRRVDFYFDGPKRPYNFADARSFSNPHIQELIRAEELMSRLRAASNVAEVNAIREEIHGFLTSNSIREFSRKGHIAPVPGAQFKSRVSRYAAFLRRRGSIFTAAVSVLGVRLLMPGALNPVTDAPSSEEGRTGNVGGEESAAPMSLARPDLNQDGFLPKAATGTR